MVDERQMKTTILEVAQKIDGTSFLDLDMAYIHHEKDGSRVIITRFFDFESGSKLGIMSKPFDYITKTNVSIREFMFGLISATSSLNEYKEEIDEIFLKRLDKIDVEGIKLCSDLDKDAQFGQCINSKDKLALSILHDIGNKTIAGDTLLDMLCLMCDGATGDVIDFSKLVNKCGLDILKLLEKMSVLILKDNKVHENKVDYFVIPILYVFAKTGLLNYAVIMPDQYSL